MTNPAGSIVNKYAYDEYGTVLNQVEAVSNPFKYVGRYGVISDDTGLLYMRARYYDPETGRFLSKDPIGFEGGDVNLYRYVGNNPLNRIDPLGLFDPWASSMWPPMDLDAPACGKSDGCKQSWAECYTNCLNVLAPGFTEFFVGSQIAVNAPYNIVVRPGPGGKLIVRQLPHSISLFYPRAWRAMANVSRFAKPIQGVAFSWVAGASYGCMISCLQDSCNY